VLRSKVYTPSMDFAHLAQARLLLVHLAMVFLTKRQDSLYVTDCCFAPLPQRHSPLQHPVGHWEVATWLSGDYHDRTFTGEQAVTFKAHHKFLIR